MDFGMSFEGQEKLKEKLKLKNMQFRKLVRFNGSPIDIP